MTAGPVVSDTSPLIAFSQIGQLALLQSLFRGLLIPSAVVREATSVGPLPTWIVERALTATLSAQVLHPALGVGESEAICLALEVGAQLILIDDRPARRHAEALGLAVIGTLGLLLAAKRRGLVVAVRPHLDALVGRGFRVAPRLLSKALADAGEEPR